jgi:4-aminobutyrate--pyruvate transaminase
MNSIRNALGEIDTRHVMHPYANLRANESGTPLIVTRGEGIHVYDSTGRQYIEGVAALWYASLGFSEERLAQAAFDQMKRLPCYHAFGNKISDVVVELTEKLVELAPPGLAHVFYSSSGSEANDTAMKLVRYYNNARGRPNKKKIIARQWAYHGTTLATSSLTGVPRNHLDFDVPAPGVIHVECPSFYRSGRDGETEEQYADRLVAEIEAVIAREGAESIAAFWAEPVMGVGGVIVPPKTYFAKIQSLLKKYDILFVVDEVIAGFGRLGKMFGSEVFDLDPDMLVLAKALSSGYAPISALLVHDRIWDVLADNSSKHGVLGHGYTYSAHPMPAAVALETLRIYEERNIIGHVQDIAPIFRANLERFRGSRIVGDIRCVGLMAGIEFVADRKTRAKFSPEIAVARIAETRCLEHGLVLRAIGDVLAISPPLIITESELADLFARLEQAVSETEAELVRLGQLPPV